MARKHLTKDRVRNTGEALSYLVDCTLATVDRLAMTKSASKNELDRQIGMAQVGIDWMRGFGVEPTGRAYDVIEKYEGSVQKYVEALRKEFVK